jgi:hypothetical protein
MEIGKVAVGRVHRVGGAGDHHAGVLPAFSVAVALLALAVAFLAGVLALAAAFLALRTLFSLLALAAARALAGAGGRVVPPIRRNAFQALLAFGLGLTLFSLAALFSLLARGCWSTWSPSPSRSCIRR